MDLATITFGGLIGVLTVMFSLLAKIEWWSNKKKF